MFPASLIKEIKNYNAGEIIFSQDTPALLYTGLLSGSAELFFNEFPLEQEDGLDTPFARIKAPFPLSGGSALLESRNQNFTLRCTEDNTHVIFWSLSDDFDCQGEDIISFIGTLVDAACALTDLLARSLNLRSQIDSMMRLYYDDMRGIVNRLQLQTKRWNSIELGAYGNLNNALANFSHHMPQLSKKKIETILNTDHSDHTKATLCPVSFKDDIFLPAGKRLSLHNSSGCLFLLAKGEIELCLGGIALMRSQEDSFIGVHSLFRQELFEYRAVRDCRIHIISNNKDDLARLLSTPTPLAKLLAQAVISYFLEVSLYLAFLNKEITRELSLIKGNDGSFYNLTSQLHSRIEKNSELNEFTAKLSEFARSISSLHQNCTFVLNDGALSLGR